ncbi:MAG: OFA family MFS transporter [Bacteroidales bacterium]|jgi:OFA family oxalate/formate antiporter-like MFS transporter
MTDMKYNRWYCVIGAVLIQFCLGVVYVWSIFLKPIVETTGWVSSDVSLAYTISLAVLPVTMIVGGYLTPKFGPRLVALLGGIMVCIGMFIAGNSSSVYMLWFGYGFLCGGGVGISYGIPIATLTKWFPDKRGLITGLAVGSLGFGSFVFSKVAYYIMMQMGALATFPILGIIVLIGVGMGAFLIKAAPDGYMPPGWTPPQKKSGAPTSYDFKPKEMLGTYQYYYLFIMYTFIMICSLMIIGHASPIGQSVAGLSPVEASTIVGLLGLFNSGGRIAWGAISDKLGRLRSIMVMSIISGVAMLSMNYLSNFWMFAIGVSLVAICFGGSVGVFPAITADNFGAKYVGINYGLILLAYSVGAIVGPIMATKVVESTGGDYSTAFIISGVLCIIGAVMAFFYKPPQAPGLQDTSENAA